MDFGLAAEQSGPLPDALQTEASVGHAVRGEADAPIPNLDAQPAVVLGEGDPQLRASAVLAPVRQALLDDAIDDVLQLGRQAAGWDVSAQFDLRPAGDGLVAYQIGDGRLESQFIEDRASARR